MPDVEIKRTVQLSREEAGQRLIALGTALTGGSTAKVDLDGESIRFVVADRLEWEFELEVDGDRTELEIELTWSDRATGDAVPADTPVPPKGRRKPGTAP